MRLRVPFVSRRSGGQDKAVPLDTGQTRDIPWWVPIFTDWGRPLAAVVVLVLCAPGEQHLAYLAGWNGELAWLSWGWAGLLSLYAGISAVVATVRPRGARGKATAVVGAGLSLLLAMAAQPVSHMFTTGYLTADPRPPLWLVIVVSSIPPFILGHLLHLASSPVRAGQVRVSRTDTARPAAVRRTALVPAVKAPDKAPEAVPADKPLRPAVSLEKAGQLVRPVPEAAVPAGQPVPSLRDKQNLSARALELAEAGQDKDAIRDTLRTEFPGAKADSVRKAANRAADKTSAAS